VLAPGDADRAAARAGGGGGRRARRREAVQTPPWPRPSAQARRLRPDAGGGAARGVPGREACGGGRGRVQPAWILCDDAQQSRRALPALAQRPSAARGHGERRLANTRPQLRAPRPEARAGTRLRLSRGVRAHASLRFRSLTFLRSPPAARRAGKARLPSKPVRVLTGRVVVCMRTCACAPVLYQQPEKWSANKPKVREDEFHPRRSYRHVGACARCGLPACLPACLPARPPARCPAHAFIHACGCAYGMQPTHPACARAHTRARPPSPSLLAQGSQAKPQDNI